MGNKYGVQFLYSREAKTQHAVDVGLIVVERIEALKCLTFFFTKRGIWGWG